MRKPIASVVLILMTAGCAASVANRGSYPDAPSNNVVMVPERSGRAPRGLNKIPPGHYPRPGECRVWYLGRPPGQQPPPVPCPSLYGRIASGAFVLFGGQPWDTEYDWVRHEREAPGSVPDAVLRLMMTIQIP